MHIQKFFLGAKGIFVLEDVLMKDMPFHKKTAYFYAL
jgi:hypothetical protein